MKPKRRTGRRELAVTSEAGEKFRRHVEALAAHHNAAMANRETEKAVRTALGVPMGTPWDGGPLAWRETYPPVGDRTDEALEACRVFDALLEAAGITREAYFRAAYHGKPLPERGAKKAK